LRIASSRLSGMMAGELPDSVTEGNNSAALRVKPACLAPTVDSGRHSEGGRRGRAPGGGSWRCCEAVA